MVLGLRKTVLAMLTLVLLGGVAMVFQNCSGGSTAGNPLREPPGPPPDGTDPISILSEYTFNGVTLRMCGDNAFLIGVEEINGSTLIRTYTVDLNNQLIVADPQSTFLGLILNFGEQNIVADSYRTRIGTTNNCNTGYAVQVQNGTGTFNIVDNTRVEIEDVVVEYVPNANNVPRIQATAPMQELIDRLSTAEDQDDILCALDPRRSGCRRF